MKNAFAIVGIIICGILIIVLIISEFPDLLHYNMNNINYSPESQHSPAEIPKLKMSIVTEPANIWDQIDELKNKKAKAQSEKENSAVSPETDNESENEESEEPAAPVTTTDDDISFEERFLNKKSPVTEAPVTEAPESAEETEDDTDPFSVFFSFQK